MTDPFKSHARSLTSPPEHAVAILPDDAGTLDVVTRALYVGTAGDLRVRMAGGGAAVTLVNVAAGSLLPIRVDRVYATGTSAGGLLGFW
jgi:poly(3-hydroxybutyrate) depolymerase